MQRKRIKIRGGQCYQNKVRRIKKWYAHIEKTRQQENENTKKIKPPLKPLEYFIDQIKKVNGESKTKSTTVVSKKKGK
jgi:hypothetical protein